MSPPKEATSFAGTFAALRPLLARHAAQLVVTADGPAAYSLDTAHVMPNGKPLFFGAVQVKKNYVSFHLMPVYARPELLAGLSPDLRRRMQGKSCFNFKSIEPALLRELAGLVDRGYAAYAQAGLVPAKGRGKT